MSELTASEKKKLLIKICTTKRGTVDYKPYNMTLLYLHKKGVGALPQCFEISM